MIHDAASTGPSADEPRLTVVLVAVQGYEIIERTVAHLRRQTIADSLELLIMASHPERVSIPQDAVEDFYDVRIVDIGVERRMGAVRAEGIRQARAEDVAMSEDHSFPNAGWAESLVAGHEAGADVVGPRMANANPGTATSWSAHLIAYAPWIDDGASRQTNMLPGHNSSYRRATMLEFGRELDSLMSAEVVAHWALHERGAKLVWQPAACCRHVNVTRPLVLASSMFHHSRAFGANRARSFHAARRWFYVLAAPLIPVLRVYRAWPMIAAHVPPNISRAKVVATFTLSAITGAAGETVGMALGAGRSTFTDWRIELDRRRLVRQEDHHLLLASAAAGNSAPAGDATGKWTDPVRIGVIGCGSLALNVHLPILARRRDAAVVAVADSAPAARETALRCAPSARVYDQAEQLIHDERVEGVLVCTPAWLHADLAVAALEACKHLYLEKPIATTALDGERVVEAWRTAGTVGMIGFNYRQHPGYVAIRNAIVCGDVGHLVSVRVTFCTPRKPMASWRGRRRQGGGVLLDLASHEIDLVHFVLGEPIVEVSAQLCSRESEDDTAHLQGRTVSGIAVHGFFSSCTVEEAGMEVYGDEGKLTLDRYGRLTVERRGAAAPGPMRNTLERLLQWRAVGYLLRRRRSPWREPSFAESLARFIGAVRAGTPGSPDLNDGLQSLRVVLAAEAAAKHGRVERVAAHSAEAAPVQLLSEARSHV
jgi:predicted dehydrogenase